ncbi:MAG: ABC transporter permease [Acidobacteriia bacterium]|nr:ABC transporter permease [Terriglobia bacterium]
MHNIFLIARREYLERIRTKAFVIMTILIPAIMIGSLTLPQIFADRESGTTRHLVVVASDSQTGQIISDGILKGKKRVLEEKKTRQQAPLGKRDLPVASHYTVDIDTDVSGAERALLTEKVKQKQLGGVIWATSESLADRKVPFITSDLAIAEHAQIEDSINHALQREILRKKGLTEAEIENAQQDIQLESQTQVGSGGSLRGTIFAMIFLITVLYISVLLYGINVSQAVVEEKSSRVMEVMLATAKAEELMAGKIMGVGAVGLTQIGIWGVASMIYPSIGMAAGAFDIRTIVPLHVLIYFPVFFLLGYTLYSSLYAAMGAMVNSQQEAQQLQQLVALPLVVPLFLIGYIIQYPNSTLSVAVSIFPLTSPLIMFARIAMGTVPPWQVALSIGLLLVTIYGTVLLCARIYRIGILMYGKKPTLPEILKWIKYT